MTAKRSSYLFFTKAKLEQMVRERVHPGSDEIVKWLTISLFANGYATDIDRAHERAEALMGEYGTPGCSLYIGDARDLRSPNPALEFAIRWMEGSTYRSASLLGRIVNASEAMEFEALGPRRQLLIAKARYCAAAPGIMRA